MAAAVDESSRVLDGGLVARQSSPSERASRGEQAVLLADALALSTQLTRLTRLAAACGRLTGMILSLF
jgi:hypothetical protein